jgi:uncharacterized repeat protein (TIGR02543 family)
MNRFCPLRPRSRLGVKRVIAGLLTAALVPLAASVSVAPATASTPVNCYSGSGANAAQNSITVEPSHGRIFFIDTGVTPRLDAAYVGYRVRNAGTTALKGHWVSLSSFTGGVVSLVNTADRFQQLPDLAAGATKTVYFLVKAGTSTNAPQSHTVRVWDGRPDVVGVTNPYSCLFSFTKVKESIKAAANKVTSVTIDDPSPDLGQLISISVNGASGTIGAGSADVGRIMWFSPAAFSSWPTLALRLESVTLQTDERVNFNSAITYSERLLITPNIAADNGTLDGLVGKRYYRNVYKFRVIARTAGAVPVKPVSQISSGTQIKHTDLASSTATINTSGANIAVSAAKSVTNCSTAAESDTHAQVRFRVSITNSTSPAVDVSVDNVVDSPSPEVEYVPGSAAVQYGSGTATTMADPATTSGSSDLLFIGPFTATTTNAVNIFYTMKVPLQAGTYANYANAYIGSQIVGASGNTTVSGVEIVSNGETRTCSTVTRALDPEAVTQDALDVATTTATLAGTIDGNGQGPTGSFEFGTDPALVGSTTISLNSGAAISGGDPSPFTFAATGLTAGSTYYFRIVATLAGVRYPGEIRHFTLNEAPSTPVAVTGTPTNIGVATATLNGSVDPNLQTITEVRFERSTNSDMSSPVSHIVYELDESGSVTSTKVSLTGANPIDVSWDVSSLAQNTTYYYVIKAVYSAGTVTGTPVRSFKTGTTQQTITFNSLTDQSLTTSTLALSATASSGLTVAFISETTAICTVSGTTVTFITTGICIITASQNGDATWAPAPEVTRTFQITAAPSVTTTSATAVRSNSATLNGSVTPNGLEAAISFCLGTSWDLTGCTTHAASQSPVAGGAGATAVSGAVASLQPGTTYFFRVFASNSAGSSTGSILQFTTLGITTASPLTSGTAGSDYSVTFSATGGSGSYATWTITAGSVPAGTTLDSATGQLAGTPTTGGTFSFALRVTDTAGATVTKEFAVTISTIAATATTTAASAVSDSSARLNGTVRAGGGTNRAVTFCLGLTSALTTGCFSASPSTASGTTATSVQLSLTALDPATTYHYRVRIGSGVVVDGVEGVVNGEILTFTTATAGFGIASLKSVQYDGNGNTGGSPPGSADFGDGDSVTVSGRGTLVKTGHTFSGWNTSADGTGTARAAGSTFSMGAADVTLYAQWSVNAYAVSYQLNGGSGTAPTQSDVHFQSNFTVASAPTRTGYTFAGWSDGTAISAAGASYTMGAGNVTLTAQWSVNSYPVTYVLNGGSGTAPTQSDVDFEAAFTAADAPSRTGYLFDGWSDGTLLSAAGGTYRMGAGAVTLTAQWTALTYVINYDGASSTGGSTPASGSFTTGGPAYVVAGNSGGLWRNGYSFSGWNTAADGSGTAYSAGVSYALSADVTLFAQWTGVPTPEPEPDPTPPPSSTPPATEPKPAPRQLTTQAKVVTTAKKSKSVVVPEVTKGSSLQVSKAFIDLTKDRVGITVDGGELTVSPVAGWTGRFSVPVLTMFGDDTVEVLTQIVVNPEMPQSGTFSLSRWNRTVISWRAADSVVIGYVVDINGTTACRVTITSCTVSRVVGPRSQVTITALGNDETRSEPANAGYRPKPVLALTVNFAENSPVLNAAQKVEMRKVATVIRREGFTRLAIVGHTDSQGGDRNAQALSDARAQAAAAYFRSLLPDVTFTALQGVGRKKPVASNATKQGQAKNRRSEILVR